MLATLSLVIRHEALARRGETIYKNGFVGDIAFDSEGGRDLLKFLSHCFDDKKSRA